MALFATNELLLIRHAPADHGGRLCGRTDVAARLPEAGIAALRSLLAEVRQVRVSPALRCVQTASALWAGLGPVTDPRLWEQDFGTMDGAPVGSLPDLGPMARAELARHAYPGGESFVQMADRVLPALADLPEGPVAVVAHAGTVRAALGHALGDIAAGLSFEVDPLSLTRLRRHAGGWSIIQTNRAA